MRNAILFSCALLISSPLLANPLSECTTSGQNHQQVTDCLTARLDAAQKKVHATMVKQTAAIQELEGLSAGAKGASAALQDALNSYNTYSDKVCTAKRLQYASGNGAGQAELACKIEVAEQFAALMD